MTAAFSDPEQNEAKLPLWRLISGLAVLATLVLLVVLAGQVYIDNFRLDRYIKDLAAQPASANLSDSVILNDILERAKQLDLPIQRSGISVTRFDGKPHIRIDRYGVQTYLVRMDLRLPEAASR